MKKRYRFWVWAKLMVPLTAILAKLKSIDIHHKSKKLEAPFENNAVITLYTRRVLAAAKAPTG